MKKKKIGPKYYPKYFIPPIGWTAIALKVSHKYTDNTWIGNTNEDGEWYVGYHGVKTKDSINNIFIEVLEEGQDKIIKITITSIH